MGGPRDQPDPVRCQHHLTVDRAGVKFVLEPSRVRTANYKASLAPYAFPLEPALTVNARGDLSSLRQGGFARHRNEIASQAHCADLHDHLTYRF